MNYPSAGYGASDDEVRRDLWGGGPDPYTMASVALEVSLPRPGKKAGGKEHAAVIQFFNWVQHKFAKEVQPTQRAMRVLVALCLLGVVLLTSLGTGLAGLADYLSIKGLATDAVNSLTHVGADLGMSKGAPQMTDAQRDAAARNDLNHARYDMQALHDRLAHPDFILSLAGSVPQVAPKLQSGLALSNIGIVGMQMLLTLVPTLVSVSKVLTASPIATSSTTNNTPLLGADDLAQIASSIQQIQPTLAQMIDLIKATPPNILVAALSSKQQGEILPLLQGAQYLPNALNVMTQFLDLPNSTAATLLGITHGPVGYLLMTLDNAEIRPVGGFQGQYAVIGVNGGRISHIALQDVYHYLEPVTYSGPNTQRYRVYDNLSLANLEPWFDSTELGWAMRNSGLSPDFPQAARYALWYLHNEELSVPTVPNPPPYQYYDCPDGATQPISNAACYAGGDRLPITNAKGEITGFAAQRIPMAGVIAIQSRVIAQLLDITGPLTIGCPYRQQVTSANLQRLIHYYQETVAGRKVGNQPCGAQVSDATKRFTALVTQALQERLRSLPKTALLRFVGDLVQDLHTKDIQIYFTDPTANQAANAGPLAFANGDRSASVYPADAAAEGFLRHDQVSNEVFQGTDDALMMSRADETGWKLEPYVHLQLVDQIQLQRDGSALHTFQAGYRFTIPMLHGSLDPVTGQPTDQTKQAIYATVYNAGYFNKYVEYWRVYTPPDALLQASSAGFAGQYVADVPNHTYFGGFLRYYWSVDPTTGLVRWSSDGTLNPTLSWIIPNAVKQGRYTIHVQPQSGVGTSIVLTITSACGGEPLAQVQGALTTNRMISVPVPSC